MEEDTKRLYDNSTPREGDMPDITTVRHVYAHDAHCNDYTGCNADCGWIPAEDAVWRSGAWRVRHG